MIEMTKKEQEKFGYIPDNPLLTIEEVASILRMHRTTITRLIAKGQFPGKRIGGQYRVRREDFINYLENNQ